MTIKRSHHSAFFVWLHAGLILSLNALWADIGVPRPDEALQQASIVAVGFFTPGNGAQPPTFTATKVLKGGIVPGNSYKVRSDAGEIQHTIDPMVKQAGSNKVLFLGTELTNNTICPIYGHGSIWPSPRYLPSDMLTPPNLEDCVSFAELKLGLSSPSTTQGGAMSQNTQAASPISISKSVSETPSSEKVVIASAAQSSLNHEPGMSILWAGVSLLIVASLCLLWKWPKRRL